MSLYPCLNSWTSLYPCLTVSIATTLSFVDFLQWSSWPRAQKSMFAVSIATSKSSIKTKTLTRFSSHLPLLQHYFRVIVGAVYYFRLLPVNNPFLDLHSSDFKRARLVWVFKWCILLLLHANVEGYDIFAIWMGERVSEAHIFIYNVLLIAIGIQPL